MAFRMESQELWLGAASRLPQKEVMGQGRSGFEKALSGAGKTLAFLKCGQYLNSSHIQSAKGFPTCCLIWFQNSPGRLMPE